MTREYVTETISAGERPDQLEDSIQEAVRRLADRYRGG